MDCEVSPRIGRWTEIQQKAVEMLSQSIYRGFRPTLASEHLRRQEIESEPRDGATVDDRRRSLESPPASVEKVHQWRPRRSRYGDLVQWDTSTHDWLAGRGGRMELILMIDDATSGW